MQKSLLFLFIAAAFAASSVHASGACTNPSPSAVKTAAVVKAASVKSANASDKTAPVIVDPSADLKEASEKFAERYPKTKVNEFSLTPVPGIFEAAVGKEVIYFDKTARFLFSGRLLDMEKGQDLTDRRLKDIRRIDIKKLPLDKAVKEVKGNGSRTLIVFTDVDCPYSRKLAKTLEQVSDVTVYTFLFPLVSIHPEAKAKSDAVWCAADSVKELAKALNGETVKSVANNPICTSPVESTLKLAAELGIGGTPTLINAVGDRTAGALPLEKLEEFINQGNKKTKS